jgi:hypothetical protein
MSSPRIHRFILVAFLLKAFPVGAQYTFVKGDHVLEVSGKLTPYFNYRFYEADETDRKKNLMNVDFAVLQLQGVYQKKFNYELQVNFRDAYTLQEVGTDDIGFLMDARVEYSWKSANISFGFGKVPFSRASLVPIFESPFLQRPEMARGEVFIRRDVGLMLSHSFLDQRLRFVGGVYSGSGETVLAGDNDPSGKLEYIGRLEFDAPSRFRYREMDLNDVPVPVFSFGAGARYAEKTVTTGPDYEVRTVDGAKFGYSVDANVKYRGWSLMAEAIRFHIDPRTDERLLGYPTDYFMTGGCILQANKYVKSVKTLLAARYDEYNPSDLTDGDTRRTISVAVNYLINGTDAMLKAQYWYRLDLEQTDEPWADNQLRIGFQLQF